MGLLLGVIIEMCLRIAGIFFKVNYNFVQMTEF